MELCDFTDNEWRPWHLSLHTGSICTPCYFNFFFFEKCGRNIEVVTRSSNIAGREHIILRDTFIARSFFMLNCCLTSSTIQIYSSGLCILKFIMCRGVDRARIYKYSHNGFSLDRAREVRRQATEDK